MSSKRVPECHLASPAARKGRLDVQLGHPYSTVWLINWKVQYRMPSTRLDTVFAALADPTRRAILARLANGQATVNQLAEPFPISLQAISKHLRVLERAELITRGRDAQWRPCQLKAGPLKDVADWVEDYRRFWEQTYERLDDYLREAQRKEQPHGQADR
jgi:DNA-binding transcriptional ArsR family regulator